MERSQRTAGKYLNQIWFVLIVTFFITNFANLSVNREQENSRSSKEISDHELISTLHIANYSTTGTNSSSTPAYPFGQARGPNDSTSSNRSNNVDTETSTVTNNPPQLIRQHGSDSDSCLGQYIYVYDLPSRFSQDLLKNCHSLQKWVDMCLYLSNLGLGPKLSGKYSEKHDQLWGSGWFSTNQFSLEVIFHNRMKQYKCLTNDSSLASAIFVPFYAGLDIGQYNFGGYNTSIRDASPLALVKWLSNRPEWKKMWGKDHFLIGGRIAWDFRRQPDDEAGWGTKLMFLPESRNMTLLSIESSSWNNEQAIPYPTYFHPSKESQVFEWQRRMRKQKRQYLFTFAGAPRPDYKPNIRNMLMTQCQSSTKYCKFVECYTVANKCEDPSYLMKVFRSSVFCLQPTGDSFTRRSTFDSILAGCIPVFFQPGSAYKQYTWHFPRNASKYSVFISENDIKEQKVMVNETLLRLPKHQVKAMREEVIRLIPKIIYADPRASGLDTLEDAFDVAVKGVLEKIKKTRMDLKEGKDPGSAFSELNANKFNMPESS